eukprot:UN09816
METLKEMQITKIGHKMKIMQKVDSISDICNDIDDNIDACLNFGVENVCLSVIGDGIYEAMDFVTDDLPDLELIIDTASNININAEENVKKERDTNVVIDGAQSVQNPYIVCSVLIIIAILIFVGGFCLEKVVNSWKDKKNKQVEIAIDLNSSEVKNEVANDGPELIKDGTGRVEKDESEVVKEELEVVNLEKAVENN